MTQNHQTIRIAYTPGEPGGIGPDLVIKYCQQDYLNESHCELVVFGSPTMLKERAKQLQLPLTLKQIDLSKPPEPLNKGGLGIIPIVTPEDTPPTVLNAKNSPYVLQCLDQAIDACQSNTCQAMVTGPIQKSIINEAGINFSGHTEYLAKQAQQKKVVMLLATEGLKVALVTTHLPLNKVADHITPENITETIKILHKDLQQKFGIANPNILVCGLNPHAGENGHLGTEEINIITPTLNHLKQHSINCIGPLPADTLFTPKYLDNADAVVAMYHDQGLPVLKYKGFGQAANITLGLPFIRTSVDHGTALDLAGTGSNIDIGSLATAIDYALAMAESSH